MVLHPEILMKEVCRGWEIGCVRERDTERERVREYAHAREACIKRAITFARETILVTDNLEIFLRFCFLSIFLKKLKFQMMVFQRSPYRFRPLTYLNVNAFPSPLSSVRQLCLAILYKDSFKAHPLFHR